MGNHENGQVQVQNGMTVGLFDVSQSPVYNSPEGLEVLCSDGFPGRDHGRRKLQNLCPSPGYAACAIIPPVPVPAPSLVDKCPGLPPGSTPESQSLQLGHSQGGNTGGL